MVVRCRFYNCQNTAVIACLALVSIVELARFATCLGVLFSCTCTALCCCQSPSPCLCVLPVSVRLVGPESRVMGKNGDPRPLGMKSFSCCEKQLECAVVSHPRCTPGDGCDRLLCRERSATTMQVILIPGRMLLLVAFGRLTFSTGLSSSFHPPFTAFLGIVVSSIYLNTTVFFTMSRVSQLDPTAGKFYSASLTFQARCQLVEEVATSFVKKNWHDSACFMH